jgi:chemotaxis response regulator CheB
MKIGIVNDMPLAVEALRRALSLDPRHQVIWTAKDGAEALALAVKQAPDLILMDLIMPNMSGVEATRQIMLEQPCAILVVTANVGVNAGLVFESMAGGALDAIDTPYLGTGDLRKNAEPLLKKINNIELRLRPDKAVGLEETKTVLRSNHPVGLVAIGASAGGPGALATLLGGLPKNFRAALVIIQHIDEMFVSGMAQWLNQYSAIPVRLAREGDRLEAGVVLLANAGEHLVLKNSNQLGYTSEPRQNIYKPSIDVFFKSVGKHAGANVVGVILTGMGADGAHGLKALRDKGYYTIAQDQGTSAVYGMPKAAVTLGAAVDILPIQDIAPKLAEVFPT